MILHYYFARRFLVMFGSVFHASGTVSKSIGLPPRLSSVKVWPASANFCNTAVNTGGQCLGKGLYPLIGLNEVNAGVAFNCMQTAGWYGRGCAPQGVTVDVRYLQAVSAHQFLADGVWVSIIFVNNDI